jgi:ribosomal protein S27E
VDRRQESAFNQGERTRAAASSDPDGPGWQSGSIPLPAGTSPFEVALSVLECLGKDHGALVTSADLRPDGTGAFTVRIPASLLDGKEETVRCPSCHSVRVVIRVDATEPWFCTSCGSEWVQETDGQARQGREEGSAGSFPGAAASDLYCSALIRTKQDQRSGRTSGRREGPPSSRLQEPGPIGAHGSRGVSLVRHTGSM